MLDEGVVVNNSATEMKSIMLEKIAKLKRTDPKTWVNAVFKAMTGYGPEDIDWEFEDNRVGFQAWVKSFNEFIEELIDDGYVKQEKGGTACERIFVANEVDPPINYSQTKTTDRK